MRYTVAVLALEDRLKTEMMESLRMAVKTIHHMNDCSFIASFATPAQFFAALASTPFNIMFISLNGLHVQDIRALNFVSSRMKMYFVRNAATNPSIADLLDPASCICAPLSIDRLAKQLRSSCTTNSICTSFAPAQRTPPPSARPIFTPTSVEESSSRVISTGTIPNKRRKIASAVRATQEVIKKADTFAPESTNLSRVFLDDVQSLPDASNYFLENVDMPFYDSLLDLDCWTSVECCSTEAPGSPLCINESAEDLVLSKLLQAAKMVVVYDCNQPNKATVMHVNDSAKTMLGLPPGHTFFDAFDFRQIMGPSTDMQAVQNMQLKLQAGKRFESFMSLYTIGPGERRHLPVMLQGTPITSGANHGNSVGAHVVTGIISVRFASAIGLAKIEVAEIC
jgi:hypothetical protein